jgi:hypothetical protein
MSVQTRYIKADIPPVTELILNRIYQRPQPTGEQYVADNPLYPDGCDSWRVFTNADPIVQLTQGIPMTVNKLKRWKLIPDNVFGHKFRFTGQTGGYYDPETLQFYDVTGSAVTRADVFPDEYMIDNHTGLGWFIYGGITNYTWYNALTVIAGMTEAGYSDYFMPNVNELNSVVDFGYTNTLGISSNPIFSNRLSNGNKWTSSTYLGAITRGWYMQTTGIRTQTPKTTTMRYFACRYHFNNIY